MLALVRSPKAVEKIPLARVPFPIAVDLFPLAIVPSPIATELSPLAFPPLADNFPDIFALPLIVTSAPKVFAPANVWSVVVTTPLLVGLASGILKVDAVPAVVILKSVPVVPVAKDGVASKIFPST